jgi:hypothetical protein
MKMIEVMNPPFDVNTHIDLRKNKIWFFSNSKEKVC